MSAVAKPNHKPSWLYRQSGVIPYRLDKKGKCEVLLITSIRKQRWIIPKGVVERDMSPADSALKEAFEEAGVRGKSKGKAMGTYSYEKWGGVCEVEVYRMKVHEILDDYPEKKCRKRAWFPLLKAVKTVTPSAVRPLLALLPKQVC